MKSFFNRIFLFYALLSSVAGQTQPDSAAVFANKMQYIAGGTFLMGNLFENDIADEMVRPVKIDAFYLAAYETTFAEYDTFCLATKRPLLSDNGWGRGENPIIFVNWFDAIAYCNWRSLRENLQACYTATDSTAQCNFAVDGYRLPTEAEWEFAAREGGKKQRFGNGSDTLSEKNANNDASVYYKTAYSKVGENRQKTVEVSHLQTKNQFGLHHLAGNVWEWCHDWYGLYPYSAQENPHGALTGTQRVLRGGSWCCSPQNCTASHRYKAAPEERANNCGFRVCKRAQK
jgi:formylglycine-generating enzyme